MFMPKADDLPLDQLDILTGFEQGNNMAGAAMLADLAIAYANRSAENGQLSKEQAEALSRLGSHLRAHFEAQVGAAYGLDEVIAKLALGLRLVWDAARCVGAESDRGLNILGSTLSDLILLREAEMRRRWELELQAKHEV